MLIGVSIFLYLERRRAVERDFLKLSKPQKKSETGRGGARGRGREDVGNWERSAGCCNFTFQFVAFGS